MKVDGKKAIVTGAAKGMGAAITTTLAREGADVVLTARETDALEQVAGDVRALGRNAHVVACDVTDDTQVKAMVDRALAAFDGRIDILVNIAGVTGPIETPVQDIDVADFDYVIKANEIGTFLPIKYVVPTMIAQRAARSSTSAARRACAATPCGPPTARPNGRCAGSRERSRWRSASTTSTSTLSAPVSSRHRA